MSHLRYYTYTVRFFVFALLAIIGSKAQSQGYYFYNNGYYESDMLFEGGLAVGVVNGMTDVGGSKRGKANSGAVGDFTFKETNLSAGIYGTMTYKNFIAGRLDISIGQVEAADSNLKGTKNSFAEGRYVRNLSFKTNIFTIGLGAELHPLMMFEYRDREPPRLSPYGFAGFSWIKFNPKAYLNGTWYELEPLRLEGQGFAEYPDRRRYKRYSFEVPYGLGLRYEASELINVRLEVAKHTLFTDYLDDVSQEKWVDPNLFDKYLTPANAAVAKQLYNRSTVINPPRNTRPRGKSKDTDAYWNVMLKVGINFSRLWDNRSNKTNNRGVKNGGRTTCPTTVI